MCLCTQLSYGLSTEYSKQPQASNQGKVDADRDKYAKFYVHQILSMGEEGIRDAYRRVSNPPLLALALALNPDCDPNLYSTSPIPSKGAVHGPHRQCICEWVLTSFTPPGYPSATPTAG